MRKGIGLSSLIMYVIGLTIIVSIITTFNLNILDATNNFTDIARLNEQYMNFNKFFINSIKDASYIVYDSSSNEINLYDSDDTLVAIYTFDNTKRKIFYSDSGEFTSGFEVCSFVDGSIQITPVDQIDETNKYRKVTIGGNPMFSLNENTASFENVTYVAGRGY